MKKRFAFNEQDLLVLLDALTFEFNYYVSPDHRDLNKAAEAYSMARRIARHGPGRMSGYWQCFPREVEQKSDLFKKEMEDWRTNLSLANEKT